MDRAYLTECVQRHGNALISRWAKKKNSDKRAECLRAALPSMLDGKVPRILLDGPKDEAERPGYLLSYLDLQTLKDDPWKLLRLIRFRTEHPPEDWARFDKTQLTRLWTLGRVKTVFNCSSVVMHGDSYGSLVQWDETESHSELTMGFPRAQLVLEAQKTLMTFLRAIVESILYGTTVVSGHSKWIESPRLGFGHSGCDASWAKFTNLPFHSPLILDIGRIIELATTMAAAAEDDLWMLQTDPAFAKRKLRCFKDELAVQHCRPDLNSPWTYGYMGEVILCRTLIRFQSWDWITARCENVDKVYREVQDQIHAQKPLPLPLNVALFRLTGEIYKAVLREIAFLDNYVAHSPEFSKSFKGDLPGDSKCRHELIYGTQDAARFWADDPLHCCLHQISVSGRLVPYTGHELDLFSLLDTLLAAPSQLGRLTPEVNECLSSLAPLYELITHTLYGIRGFSPKDTTDHRVFAPRPIRRWKAERVPYTVSIPDLKKLDTLLRSFDALPLPSGKRDAVWLRDSAAIRQRLQEFWVGCARAMRRALTDADPPSTKEDIESAMEFFQYASTPNHLAALQAEREVILTPKPRRQPLAEPEYKVPTERSAADAPKKSQLDIPMRRAKAKTRPTAQPQPQPHDAAAALAHLRVDDAEEPAAEPAEPAPTIAVKPESLRVLQQMFPSAAPPEHARLVKWVNVVDAIADAGFTAAHGGGSGVTFSCAGRGSICFHRPHPDNKVDPVVLHGMGRRMNRWFGWTRESFVERRKLSDE